MAKQPEFAEGTKLPWGDSGGFLFLYIPSAEWDIVGIVFCFVR